MSIEIRPLRPGEEAAVCELARRVFDRDVAGDLAPEGVAEFHRYAETSALADRLKADHVALVAERGGALAGVVEIQHGRHIAMLFVDPSAQGAGVGRALLQSALSLCAASPAAPEAVTVHSGLGAVAFYERMGFAPTGPERTVDGIRFVPMAIPSAPLP